jgi:DNA polymerase alpha-associated DNA helicase A
MRDRMEGALKQLKEIIKSPSLCEAMVRLISWEVLPLICSDQGVHRRSQLIEVLLGLAMPSRIPAIHSMTFFDDSLNDSQKVAVVFALESVEVACIHGPPGESL